MIPLWLSTGIPMPSFNWYAESGAHGGLPLSFTRATASSIQDHEGRIVYPLSGEMPILGGRRVANVITGSSEDFSGWSKDATGTVTAGISDPDGGTTASTFTAVANNDNLYKALGSQTGTFLPSMWIRRRTGTGTISLARNAFTLVDLTSTITSTWQRILVPGVTASASSTIVIGIQLATAGDAVDIWHPMWENVTGQSNQNPSEYVSVGVLSTPYHGYFVDGVKYFSTLNGNTVASNVVTEATGAAITDANSSYANANGPLGYYPQGARTNNSIYSRTWTNAAWVAGGGGVTKAQDAVGTDGVPNAAGTLTATGANGTVLQSITLASQANVFQPFIKRKTGTGTIEVTVDGGTTWTDVTSQINGSTFTQVQTTKTAANPQIGFRIVTSGDAIYVDHGDCQGGTFASTPIPTTTVAVARNADVESAPSAGILNSAAMTLAIKWTPGSAGMGTIFLFGTYVDASNYTAILHDGTNIIARKRIAGVNTDATKALTYAAGTQYRITARFDSTNGSDIWVDGVKGTNDATTTASQIGTNFQIGADGNSLQQAFGAIQIFKAYRTGLSDAQAASL